MMRKQWIERCQNDIDLALYCFYLKSKKKRNRKVKRLTARREEKGVYNILIERYLLDSEKDFREYMRLSPSEFDYVLSAVHTDLQSQKTKWIPNPISAQQKLSITLR